MRLVAPSTLLAVLGPPLAAATAHVVSRSTVVGRDVQLLDSYDYVVVGGGGSGLTVADRLTENPNVTVLVIEAGSLGEGEEAILVPYMSWNIPAKYFYSIPSGPIAGLNNRSSPLRVGKAVGGGTAVNNMFNPRGSKGDYDIWEALGNPGWGFDGLLPYFIKSETFTPPPANIAQEFGITWDMQYHGTSGPVQISYPNFQFPIVKHFLKAIKEFGSHVPNDYCSGDALGGYWVPNTIDPVNRTRSFSRTAHYERVRTRQNLHLLPDNTVTQIIFEGKTATGVKFAAARGQTVRSVSAKREVIVAAGAAHTPQVLQLSGVGPKKLLDSLGIAVVSELPGVGSNFHDHPVVGVGGTYLNDLKPNPSDSYNATWMAEQYELYRRTREGIYSTAASNTVAFLPLNEITSAEVTNSIISKLQSQNPSTIFPTGTDPTVLDGWKAQRDIIAQYMKESKIAVGEFATGYSPGGALALIRPLSRGSITIKSKDAFDNPTVDFATLRNPVDLDMSVEMIRAWRKILLTPSLQSLNPVRDTPADSVTSNADLGAYVKANMGPTIAHPSGSAPMMKKELGGVVGPDLLVYGVQRLSIIDTSIFPVVPSVPTTTTVYAVAEKAAEIIKARNA